MTGPLELQSIKNLGYFDVDNDSYNVYASADNFITRTLLAPRPFPLWIALDQITDPGNLGAILRTAYFFGIDGVVLSTKNRYRLLT